MKVCPGVWDFQVGHVQFPANRRRFLSCGPTKRCKTLQTLTLSWKLKLPFSKNSSPAMFCLQKIQVPMLAVPFGQDPFFCAHEAVMPWKKKQVFFTSKFWSLSLTWDIQGTLCEQLNLFTFQNVQKHYCLPKWRLILYPLRRGFTMWDDEKPYENYWIRWNSVSIDSTEVQ